MESIKKYIIGIIIGLLLGLWFGVNIGRDKPIWSNPFDQPNLAETAKQKATNIKDKATEKANSMIKDAKKAVREKLEE